MTDHQHGRVYGSFACIHSSASAMTCIDGLPSRLPSAPDVEELQRGEHSFEFSCRQEKNSPLALAAAEPRPQTQSAMEEHPGSAFGALHLPIRAAVPEPSQQLAQEEVFNKLSQSCRLVPHGSVTSSRAKLRSRQFLRWLYSDQAETPERYPCLESSASLGQLGAVALSVGTVAGVSVRQSGWEV